MRSGATSRQSARFALLLLLAVYILNFLDRQILNILAEPIKQELGLADWQLGLMTGFAFAIFYTVLGIPLARLSERGNRVQIISCALAVWSFFTAACGLAQNLLQLLACRVAVGVGEAGCTPAAHSLITDYVEPGRRASALAFYSLGIPLGSMAGMIIGGVMADAYGWRIAMLAVGLPGIVLAIVVFFLLPEPRLVDRRVIKDDIPTFRETLKLLAGKRAFWWAAGGASATSFVTYGYTAFFGSFFLRNHGPQIERLAAQASMLTGWTVGPTGLIGIALGVLIGVAGALGTASGGRLADRRGEADTRAYVDVPAMAVLVGAPISAAAFLVGDAVAATLLLIIPTFLKSFWYGPVFALTQSLVPSRSRATAAAILLFVFNLVGLGFGPLVIGIASDVLSLWLGPAAGLRWAMAASCMLGFVSAACFYKARKTLRTDWES